MLTIKKIGDNKIKSEIYSSLYSKSKALIFVDILTFLLYVTYDYTNII